MLPPLKILLGAASDGLSEELLTQFLAAPNRTLMILPSTEQMDTVLKLASARAEITASEIVEKFTTFDALVAKINNQAINTPRTISRALKRLALAELMPRVIRTDSFFGKMLDAPGFIPALSDSIREWKLAGLTPELLESSAFEAADRLENPAYSRKASEMALLFREYETFLTKHHLRDEEDCLWAAKELLISETAKLPYSATTVMVDGFYRFSHAQRDFLAAMAGQGQASGSPINEVIVTLHYSADRSLLFAAPERTLQLLRDCFTTNETVLPHVKEQLDSALSVLGNRIFSPGDPNLQALKISAPDMLKIFDAPNPYVESEMVAREFRRLHDEDGYAWKDMTIILRTMGEYAPILSAVFERYKVPLDVDGPEVMDENPVIKTLLSFFEVVRRRWQRNDVLDFLKSSYTFPDKLQVDFLRKRARKNSIREGREEFLQLGGTDTESSLFFTLQEMARFDIFLTSRKMDYKEFEDCIHQMTEVFGINDRITNGEPSRQERDRAALHAAMEVLDAMTEIGRISSRGPITFPRFHDELASGWRGKAVVASSPSDQVRVAEPYDSRKHPVRIAAVMGLTERGFPRRISEDPFLRDVERHILMQVAGVELEELKSRSDDERFFFYLSVTAPADRLILSFPRSTDESDALPSFYLDEVRSIFASDKVGLHSPTPVVVSRTLADVAPRSEESVTVEDRLLSGCADLFDPGLESDFIRRSEKQIAAKKLLGGLLKHDDIGTKTREILESRRLPLLPKLTNKENISHFSKRRLFTVTELETYRRCPFQYMMRYKLKLIPVQDGAGRQIQGTILHAVLREYFMRAKDDLGSTYMDSMTEPERLSQMKFELHQLLLEMLEKFRPDATSHRIQMAQRLLSDALDRFAEREIQFRPLFGMTPKYFELGFGPEAPSDTSDEELNSNVRDPTSTLVPLVLKNADDSMTISICGKIDRVDIGDGSDRAIVMDYKLGQSPEYKEMQNGVSLQMPLYMMAAERLFVLKPVAGCYDSMEDQGRPRIFRLERGIPKQFGVLKGLDKSTSVTPLNRDQYSDLISTAEASALRIAEDIASTRVDATPGNHCRFCDYGDVCRTTVIEGHDGEQLLP